MIRNALERAYRAVRGYLKGDDNVLAPSPASLESPEGQAAKHQHWLALKKPANTPATHLQSSFSKDRKSTPLSQRSYNILYLPSRTFVG
jgi:hypothetical protein